MRGDLLDAVLSLAGLLVEHGRDARLRLLADDLEVRVGRARRSERVALARAGLGHEASEKSGGGATPGSRRPGSCFKCARVSAFARQLRDQLQLRKFN